ncbi:MAG: minichromosome maintenance protein MCM [Candidatus Bathyarchaeia archaeon]
MMEKEGRWNPEDRLRDFFSSYRDEAGEYSYRVRLAQMAAARQRVLHVRFEDLISFDDSLARSLVEEPDKLLPMAERAALAQLRTEALDYAEEVGSLRVRLRGFPGTLPLRELGSEHVNKLVRIDGILVRATPVKPLLMVGAFKCRRCGTLNRVPQSGIFMTEPTWCENRSCKGSASFEFSQSDSTFINYQEVRAQERPEDLPPGQTPRWLDVKLTEDLVDLARPGDHVSITGIVRAVQETLARSKMRTFDLVLEANHVEVAGKEAEVVEITPEEEAEIRKQSRDPWIHDKMIRSIAPSLFGLDHVKEALLYLLFGGVPVSTKEGIQIRGDINVLLIGDPGTGKSQLLQYIHRIAPRGLYTHGRGTTAAGLTAAVIRDSRSGGMTLEAGAMVLSDRGICAIDEIDKMRPEDRVSVHEAMEQQTVSIAKGGIVARLNARAAVLAAANPALGRYDPYRNVSENISLPVTILSRFDVIFVLRDEPDKDLDARMAEHVLTLHGKGAPPEAPPIDPLLMKKYISYARQLRPAMSKEAKERIQDFYLKMRAAPESGSESPVAITVRQLESVVRIAEARAKIALRETVTVEDAEAAIKLMTKSLSQVGVDLATGKPDIDTLMTGKPKSVRDKLQAVLSTVFQLERETGIAKEEDVYEILRTQHGVERGEAVALIGQLRRDGTLYSPREGYLKKT